jgi:hypothetical protein
MAAFPITINYPMTRDRASGPSLADVQQIAGDLSSRGEEKDVVIG